MLENCSKVWYMVTNSFLNLWHMHSAIDTVGALLQIHLEPVYLYTLTASSPHTPYIITMALERCSLGTKSPTIADGDTFPSGSLNTMAIFYGSLYPTHDNNKTVLDSDFPV